MANIAYGSSTDPSLPPVALPSMNDAPQPLRITVTKGGTPPVADGGWAPYTAPEQQPTPQAADGGWAPYSPPEQPAQRDVGGGEAALRGAAHGLTFGFYPAIAGAAAGAKSAVSGGSFSDAYDQTRQEEQDAQKQASEQHPYIYGASDIAANIPTMFIPGLGMGKAAMAATEALPRIGGAIRAGATAGGLFGAGEQTSQGASPLDVAKGAAGGAAAGGAIGGVLGSGIEGATHIGRRVGSIVRGGRDSDAEASRLVVEQLHGDQKQVANLAGDQPGLAAAQQAGTDVRIADFGGGNTKALLRASTNISPEARDIVGEAVGSRFSQQGDRISRFIRSQFGGIESDAAVEAIRDAARKANAPAYRAAYQQGDRQIWTPELERLTAAPFVSAALRGAISKWKNYAVRDGYGAMNPPFRVENGGIVSVGGKGMPVYPNIQLWDYAARELQDKARAAPIGSEAGKLYNDLARLLKNELDKEVPAYETARVGAAKFFKAKDAVEAGKNFVRDTSISDRVAVDALNKMSDPEKELFRRSFAEELARVLERIGDNRNVLNSIFVNNGPARRRILIALGEENAGRLEALLRVEGIVDRTRRALGNSTTIQQGADAGKFAGTLATVEGLKGAFNPVYLIAIPLIWAGRQTAKKVDEGVFTKVAEMLMSDDPTVFAKGLDIVSKNPNVRTALRYASDLGSREIVNLLGPSGVGSAALTGGSYLRGSGTPTPPHYPQDEYQGGNPQ